MLISMLISLERSYESAALHNDYSYLVSKMQTPNLTEYNYLLINPMAHNGEKYADMLFAKRKPLNFTQKERCLNLLKGFIKKNKIVLVGVDLFYWIPNSVCWNKHHWEHYSFVNGFNDEKKVLYVFDENFSGYNEFEIPEDRFIKAIANCPLEPHGYICKLSKNIERFELLLCEIRDNAKRIVDEINKIIPVTFWELSEEDFVGGHMCDLISTQIFQIVNRHITNQLLIKELDDEVLSPLIRNSLVKYCIELQEGWALVKNQFIRIYFANNKKSLVTDINEKCKILLLKEIDMWNMLLNHTI